MERTITSILGFQTLSISPSSIAHDLQMLQMTKQEQWHSLWKHTWDKMLFFALAIYTFVFISFAAGSGVNSHTWIITGLLGTLLSVISILIVAVIHIDVYVTDKNKLLRRIIKKYEAFNRDVLMVNNDVNIHYFCSGETKVKLDDFLRKVKELREFEFIAPAENMDMKLYSRYTNLLSWFMLYSLYCTTAQRVP